MAAPGQPTAGDEPRGDVPSLVEYGLIAAIAIVVAVLALTVFDDQVIYVLSVIGSEIDRAT
jgi:Flp pilus assembly pilin Flp